MRANRCRKARRMPTRSSTTRSSFLDLTANCQRYYFPGGHHASPCWRYFPSGHDASPRADPRVRLASQGVTSSATQNTKPPTTQIRLSLVVSAVRDEPCPERQPGVGLAPHPRPMGLWQNARPATHLAVRNPRYSEGPGDTSRPGWVLVAPWLATLSAIESAPSTHETLRPCVLSTDSCESTVTVFSLALRSAQGCAQCSWRRALTDHGVDVSRSRPPSVPRRTPLPLRQ
jgi:hypothetical protein